MSHLLDTRNGTWADLVALPADDLAPAPYGATLIESAALPLAGLTALQAWQIPTLRPDARVLVIGAAGATGAALVQLAVESAVTADGVVSRTEHLDEVKRFGVGLVTTDQAQLPAGRYEAIFDTVGLPACGVDAQRLLTSSGVHVGLPSAAELPDDVDARRVLVARDPVGLRRLTGMVDAGTLRLRVAASYPLRDIREAHAHAEARGLLGKIIVVF